MLVACSWQNGGAVSVLSSMLRPSSTPVRTNQARLVACHVGASMLQNGANASNRTVWANDVRTNLADTIRALADLVREMASRPQRAVGDSTGQFAIVLDDEAQASTSDDPVGDVAFIAASHLRRKAAELEQVMAAASDDPRAEARLLESLNSCLRHVLKATTTVEPILATTYGLVPRLNAHDARVRSLAIRRAYTQFRRSVTSLVADDAGIAEAERALRALASDASARDFRPSDAAEIDALLGRLTEVKRVAPRDPLAPDRWLGDVTAFATMLRAIDRREELITHDLEALPEVLAHVEALMGAGKLVLRGHLEKIRGIDERIEAMLEPGMSIDAGKLSAELQRVLAERRLMLGLG